MSTTRAGIQVRYLLAFRGTDIGSMDSIEADEKSHILWARCVCLLRFRRSIRLRNICTPLTSVLASLTPAEPNPSMGASGNRTRRLRFIWPTTKPAAWPMGPCICLACTGCVTCVPSRLPVPPLEKPRPTDPSAVRVAKLTWIVPHGVLAAWLTVLSGSST